MAFEKSSTTRLASVVLLVGLRRLQRAVRAAPASGRSSSFNPEQRSRCHANGGKDRRTSTKSKSEVLCLRTQRSRCFAKVAVESVFA